MQALGLDLVSWLWQLLAFAGLVYLLNRLLFKPIRKTLDERAERIRESMEEAERIKQQALRADEEYQARQEEARREAAGIIARAREEARQERERILQQAEAEARQRRADAEAQIELERRDMLRQARQQVAGLAVLAAGRIIGEELDGARHRRLAEEQVVALAEPLAELRQALLTLPTEAVRAVQVRSAVPLAEELQAQVREQVTGVLGEGVEVRFGVEPGIIGGLVLQVGDQVVDLSVARKLNDLFRELAA